MRQIILTAEGAVAVAEVEVTAVVAEEDVVLTKTEAIVLQLPTRCELHSKTFRRILPSLHCIIVYILSSTPLHSIPLRKHYIYLCSRSMYPKP